MAVMLHRTLKGSSNTINVIHGDFFPGIDTSHFIWNMNTSFHVVKWVDAVTQDAVQKVYAQPFLSNVFAICKGPRITEHGFDSFFAAREDDIVQFCFSSEEEIFICVKHFQLPRICICPVFLLFSEPFLVASAKHGGLCTFCVTDGKVIAAKKLTNVVMEAFGTSGSRLVRVEGGLKVAVYDIATLDVLIFVNINQGQHEDVTSILDCGNGRIGICKRNEITVRTLDNSRSDIKLMIRAADIDARVMGDSVFSHCTLSKSPLLVVMLTNRQHTIFVLSEDGTGNVSVRVLSSAAKFWDSGIRILGLGSSTFLTVNAGKGHTVFNLRTKEHSESYSKSLGLRFLVMTTSKIRGSSTDECGVVPHALSVASKSVSILKQGIPTKVVHSEDVGEGITGLFPLKFGDRNFVIVSYVKTSAIFEFREDKFFKSSNLITEGCRTIAVIMKDYAKQILPNGWAAIPVTAKGAHTSATTVIDFFFARGDQRCMVTKDKDGNRYLIIDKGKDLIDHTVTVMCPSPRDPETGRSDYLGFGCAQRPQGANNCEYFVLVVSFDAEKVTRREVLRQEVRARVSALEFHVGDDEQGNMGTYIIIGLDNGSVIMGLIGERPDSLEDMQAYQVCAGPVRFVRLRDKFVVMGARPHTLNIARGTMVMSPLIMAPCAFAIGRAGDRFFGVSGRHLSSYQIEDTCENGLCSYDMPVSNNLIRGIFPLDSLQCIILATRTEIMFIDIITWELKFRHSVPSGTECLCAAVSPGDTGIKYLAYAGVKKTGEGRVETSVTLFSITSNVRVGDNIEFECKARTRVAPTATAMAIFVRRKMAYVVVGYQAGLGVWRPHKGFLEMVTTFSVAYTPTILLPAQQWDRNEDECTVIISDGIRSVYQCSYSTTRHTFDVKAEEAFGHVTTLGWPMRGEVPGGDRLGNIFIMKSTSDRSRGKGEVTDATRYRLRRYMHFHIGETVTGVDRSRDTFEFLWYRTIAGSFGGFLCLSSVGELSDRMHRDFERRVKLFRALEMEISSTFYELTMCDHISFRNKYYPSTNIIDMDIVWLFIGFSRRLQERILVSVRTVLGLSEKDLTYVVVARDLDRVARYFNMWHRMG